MPTSVKPRRRYNSTRRKEQATETRRAILRAAQTLFLERGYARTTMSRIATVAGVSTETVYKVFRNKAGLVKAVFDVAIVGDDERIPMLERELVAQIRSEADPREKVRMYGAHVAAAGRRTGQLQLLIRSAAETDREVLDVWRQMSAERLTGMTRFAQDLDADGHLRNGLSVEEARDVLWTFNSVELYDLLVLQRGWTHERYGRWIGDALIAALL